MSNAVARLQSWLAAALSARTPKQWAVIRVVAAITLLAFGPGLFEQGRLAWKRHRMEARLRTLDRAAHELTEEQRRLTSDTVYVEGLIRSTFKVAKPNEYVVPVDPELAAGLRRR